MTLRPNLEARTLVEFYEFPLFIQMTSRQWVNRGDSASLKITEIAITYKRWNLTRLSRSIVATDPV